MLIRYLIGLVMSMLVVNASLATPNSIIQKLDARMKLSDSLVCVGLDPDIIKMPEEIMKGKDRSEEKVFKFLKEVIDITAPHASAYKIQKAFFDTFDQGHGLLKKTIAYIHQKYPDIPAFVDCKIGDTENTMEAYMHTLFDKFKADAVVINPYMGDDTLEPFLLDKNKTAIVLIQTSNPSAQIVQGLRLDNGKPLWEEMLDLALTRWNKNENLIPVLSSNVEQQNYRLIRQKLPNDMPILLAGVGSQGGDPEVLRQLLNSDKRGVFVNSSRGILYPYDKKDPKWREQILKAVIDLKTTLNNIRYEGSSVANATQAKFLLLLGPSGTGKSTIIENLKKADNRFKYVTPYTTRTLRPNETDKVSISASEMQQLQKSGKLLTMNTLYGIHYGTPKNLIDDALSSQNYPILDWPVSKMDLMAQAYPNNLYVVYVAPPSIDVLKSRLSNDDRDKDNKRFVSGKEELADFEQGKFDHVVNLKIVNHDSAESARQIYQEFIKSLN